MRVFILYPPISKQERYSSQIGNAGGNQIPLGIFYLASHLRNNGHIVEVVDAEARNLDADALLTMIASFEPDIVGISSTTVAFHRSVEVAELVEQQFPNLPIILGGPHVTANPVLALKDSLFKIGIIGEGEITLLELLDAIKNGTNFETIQGLVFKKDGEIIQTEKRPYIDNIDTIPFPAYDLIPNMSDYAPPPCNYKAIPVANIITSRGCPNQCTFCDQSIFGRKLRQRSPENIATEMIILYRQYGIREIAFVDDTFTINNRRIPALFSILDKEKINFPWTCMSRVNTVDEEILRYMKRKGCWHISFGIESGNPEILKIIKKNIQLEQVKKIISLCSKIGIKTKGFFIVGHPGETKETIEQTIQFALHLPLDDVVVCINTPIPGSIQYAEAEQYGSLDTTDWKQFNYHRPVFVPRDMTEEQLKEAYRQFYRKFYLRPRVIMRYCQSFLMPGGYKRFFSLAKAVPFLFKKVK
ncbi:MAG: B12-binding domain-containing radical SAM protein [Planctomycetaceae bacterium]|jgi:radical SAM superfamily enzyme YgiQ (UPF0313 family)|nr:B12-binding domain-containing radical SAM protein [Planctomycetaceae bacterium]